MPRAQVAALDEKRQELAREERALTAELQQLAADEWQAESPVVDSAAAH